MGIYARIMKSIARPMWMGDYAGVVWLFGEFACFAAATAATWIGATFALARRQIVSR
jgi:hypothetical protein